MLKRSEGPAPRTAIAIQLAAYRPFGPLEATIAAMQPRSYDRGYYLTALRASAAFSGASSCAASGCHGSVAGNAPAWQTAFSTWVANDPHARAYDVLWTFRGREMTRLLDDAASDQQHRASLQQRCIACHATPPADENEAAAGAYALGVQCESCHGPASGWLHAHDRAGFSRTSTEGFIDTKNLSQRAGACVDCHTGPKETTDQSQAVDHDLIAAGHPRLAFEFHSYFQSLPAHWNREADEAEHSGAFHYQSWLAGQTQAAEQRKLLSRDRPRDFAQLDCYACHHQLEGASWRQRFKQELLAPGSWPRGPLLHEAQPDLSTSARLALARALLLDSGGVDGSWDAAVQSYLAARAIASDVTHAAYPQAEKELTALNAALADLGTFLGRECFAAASRDSRPPTQYDSPTKFAPGPLAERIRPVSDALQRVEAKMGQK